MARESVDHTLQPTALVHEAWLKLVKGKTESWESRGHFFAAAAEAMRRILIDVARRKAAKRRGGGLQRLDIESIDLPAEAEEETLIRVNEALDTLAEEDPKSAELVKLRFFAGMSVEEAALAMGVTDRTARRYWRFARIWLYERMRATGEADRRS
jgi:RNA polymerase sigma factor (TIGR02999 family)